MLIVALLFTVVSIGLVLFGESKPTQPELAIVGDSTYPARGNTDTIRPAKTIGLFNPRGGQHKGFLGMIGDNVKIVSDHVSDIEIGPFEPDDRSYLEADLVSFSPIPGDDTGLYLPEGDFSTGIYVSPVRSQHPVSRSVSIAHLKHPTYPLVATKRFGDIIEGVVTVLVLINKSGEITPFSYKTVNSRYRLCKVGEGNKCRPIHLINEDPEGYFFYRNLERVLPEWRFAPAVLDGLPTDRLLEITYHYCQTQDCRYYKIKELQEDGTYRYRASSHSNRVQ